MIQSFAVASGNTIHLGDVVRINDDGTVQLPAAGDTGPLGVVVNIQFRGEYDQYPGGSMIDPYTASEGTMVAVAVRGIVVVNADSGTTFANGNLLQAQTDGTVNTLTLSAAGDAAKVVGRVIEADNTNHRVKVLLGL